MPQRGLSFSPNLVFNLKRQIQDLQARVEAKNEELESFKRKIKSTKTKELEIEVQEYQKAMLSMKQTIGDIILEQRKKPKMLPQDEENQAYIQKVIASKTGIPEDSDRESKRQEQENKELREQIRLL